MESHLPDLLSKPWTPFQRCLPDLRDPESSIYRNSRYQVHVQRHMAEQEGIPDLVHLSFKRIDQQILIPFQDKLRIKDELVNPECEGVELLPARSREVDLANQFHLWVVDSVGFRFPVSFHLRLPSLDAPLLTQNEDLLKRHWTPLLLYEEAEGSATYCNSRYQVHLQRFSSHDPGPDLIGIFVQRLDLSPLIPYRDRMRIKDELTHPENEEIELLPARSRAIPMMNGCLLWIVDDPTFRFPFGFAQRYVTDIAFDGAVQEPWPDGERPADCLSEEALREAFRKERRHG